MTLSFPSRAGSFRGAGWTPRIVLSLISTLFVVEAVALAYTCVATALPAITQHFHTTAGGWLLTSYALVGAIASPLFGKLADLHGKRRVLIIALTAAVLGDALAAVAPVFWVMVVGQALHGCICACMFLGYSLMRDVYPKRTIPFAVSISMTGSGALALLVPFAIGALLDNYGFRSLFLFDLVWVAVLGTAMVAFTPESKLRSPARMDLLGSFLIAAGLGIALVAVSMGSTWGWTSFGTIGLIVLGLLLLAAYPVVAARRPDPVINLRTLGKRPILFAVITAGVAYGINPMALVVLPMLGMTPAKLGGDYGLGLTASQYALISSPQALGGVVGGLGVGLLVRRVGGRRTMYAGLVLAALGALFLTLRHDALWEMSLGAAVFGLGCGTCFASLPNLIIAATPADQQGSISSVGNLVSGVVGAITPVIAFAILASGAHSPVPGVLVYSGSGIRTTLAVVTCLAVAALVVGAVFLRPRADDARVGQPIAEEALPA